MALSPEGSLFNDFLFDDGLSDMGQNILHLRNAPSPAATTALAIGCELADEAEKRFSLCKL